MGNSSLTEVNYLIKKKRLCCGNAAVDVQHVGSTAIASIYAKPIIDIVIVITIYVI